MLKIKKKSHVLFVSQSVSLGSRDVKWKRHKLMNMRYVRVTVVVDRHCHSPPNRHKIISST